MGERKTVLAIGAHAGDMEVSCGAVLYKHAQQGDRVVLLHLTLGEGGNPRMTPAAYGEQKRREAEAIARAMGAEVLFGPYRDGELPVSDEARLFVADAIRTVKPTHIVTHWRNSIHKDHAAAYVLTMDAVLLASLESVDTGHDRPLEAHHLKIVRQGLFDESACLILIPWQLGVDASDGLQSLTHVETPVDVVRLFQIPVITAEELEGEVSGTIRAG